MGAKRPPTVRVRVGSRPSHARGVRPTSDRKRRPCMPSGGRPAQSTVSRADAAEPTDASAITGRIEGGARDCRALREHLDGLSSARRPTARVSFRPRAETLAALGAPVRDADTCPSSTVLVEPGPDLAELATMGRALY